MPKINFPAQEEFDQDQPQTESREPTPEEKRIIQKCMKMNNYKRLWEKKIPYKFKATYSPASYADESALDMAILAVDQQIFSFELPTQLWSFFIKISEIAETLSYKLPSVTYNQVPHLAGITDDIKVAIESGHLDDEMENFLLWLGMKFGVGAKSRGLTKLGLILAKRVAKNKGMAYNPKTDLPQYKKDTVNKNKDL